MCFLFRIFTIRNETVCAGLAEVDSKLSEKQQPSQHTNDNLTGLNFSVCHILIYHRTIPTLLFFFPS